MVSEKRIAIIQSNYIPWKGYFDIIADVDEFIIYDDVQYTRRDWRNRNKIKTPQGAQWLTVPVQTKGKYFQSIFDTEISSQTWQATHWSKLCQHYKQAPYFDEISSMLKPLYLDYEFSHLSQMNRKFIETICAYLGVNTIITNSSSYDIKGTKSECLLNICLQAHASEYVSGPSAKVYLDTEIFTQCAIKLTWYDYGEYPSYPQLWREFDHHVSILDLLFNCGKDAPNFMKYSPTLR